MISGINHITLSVKKLTHSIHFYQEALGFQLLMSHSKGAYFLAGDFWLCLDEDSNTRLEPLLEYSHIDVLSEKGLVVYYLRMQL